MSSDPYNPVGMMRKTAWLMSKQVDEIYGMLTPETRLMAWQPHILSQAQRDVEVIYNTLSYNRAKEQGLAGESFGELGRPPNMDPNTVALLAGAGLVWTFGVGPWMVGQFQSEWGYGKRLLASLILGTVLGKVSRSVNPSPSRRRTG